MPRFVLLHHDWPSHHERPTHCDLMLEAGAALQTWSLSRLPRDWLLLAAAGQGKSSAAPTIGPTNVVHVERLDDHRPAYLDYEGPVSGSRGTVRRLDAGTYAVDEQTPERSIFTITGQTIRGRIKLELCAPPDRHWRLTFEPAVEES